MKFIFSALTILFVVYTNAQSYTSYFTGNTADVASEPLFGVPFHVTFFEAFFF